MNCLVVRERLAERALGGLSTREVGPIDRHLVWCAACRKEAGQFDLAAATLAFSVAPAAEGPPAHLEERVLQAVQHDVASKRAGIHHGGPRRGRFAIAAALAAVLSLSGLAWGAVMAGKAAQSDRAAEAAERGQSTAMAEFRRILESPDFADPEGEVLLGNLEPVHEGGGGGSVLTLVSPQIPDMAIVLLDGVPEAGWASVPYSVRMVGPGGNSLLVGKISALDSGGSGIVVVKIDDGETDLTAFERVVVRDVDGRVVMRGAIAARAPIASPSP